jgi:hypothetical protein
MLPIHIAVKESQLCRSSGGILKPASLFAIYTPFAGLSLDLFNNPVGYFTSPAISRPALRFGAAKLPCVAEFV